MADLIEHTAHVIRIRGHRINLEHVLERAAAGMTATEIAEDFGTISPAQAQAVLDYAADHRPIVDAYLARLDAWTRESIRQQDAGPHLPVVARILAARTA